MFASVNMVLLLRSLAVTTFMVVTLASLGKSFGLFVNPLYWLEHQVGGDGVLHFSFSFTIGLLAQLSVLSVQAKNNRKRQLLTLAFLFVVFTFDEFAQLAFPARQFSWFDLFLNYSGLFTSIICVWLIALIIKSVKK